MLPPCSRALSSIKHKCACRHTDQTPVLACVWHCLEAVFPVKRPCLETLWVFTVGRVQGTRVCDCYLVGRQQKVLLNTTLCTGQPRLSLPPPRMDWPEGPRYGGPGQQHVRQKADPDYRRIPEGNKVKAHWSRCGKLSEDGGSTKAGLSFLLIQINTQCIKIIHLRTSSL